MRRKRCAENIFKRWAEDEKKMRRRRKKRCAEDDNWLTAQKWPQEP